MTEAKQELAAAEAIPHFSLEAASFDASKAKGKTLFLLPITTNDQFAASIDEEMVKISHELGIKTVVFNNQGSSSEWTQGMNQAISEHVDAIALVAGPEPTVILPQLEKAKAEGIPSAIANYYQGPEVPASVKKVMAGFVQGPFAEAGKLMADWAFVKTGGEPHPLIVTAEEAAPSAAMVEAIEAQVKQLCPSCTTTTTNVPVPDWASKMQGAVQSALLKDPEINSVLPLYDSMSIGAAAGISAASKEGQIGIASYNGTPAVMKLIEEGEVMEMDAGENTNWIAYAMMDQELRLLSGEPVVPDGINNEALPLRVFNDGNIADAGSPPAAGKGYGEEYVEGYEKLWGLKH
ncbi:MAG: sugar ABC transporter substrate-binding protein [Actinobacteria bacterium]|nr:sugar ABC transporter substrate-binding protein [Actinomycetota bacterium]